MQHYILNDKLLAAPESKTLVQFYKAKMQKIETQIADEDNKSTKIRMLKDCEAERNLYHEECGRLNLMVKQLRNDIDNLKLSGGETNFSNQNFQQ